jgi:putative glutamine amidotransferase
MKPLIGIPAYSVYGAPPGEAKRYVISRSYVEAVRAAGGAVIALPASTDPEALRPAYAALAGLLLQGGGDLEAHRYGQADSGKLTLVDPERDEAEILLARWAVEDDLPVLAICRGVQVLNVALGGTLVQDIPSQVEGALVHSPGAGAPRARPQHTVRVEAGSRLAGALGRGRPLGRLEVNSFHHQAVAEPAPSLQVVARAPDGIIEALERPDRSFAIGVQWHPEEMADTDPAQAALFAAFVAACAKHRG